MAGLQLDALTKRFDDTLAVDAIDLDIADQEFLVLLGPSGCGKSTVLRLIAGLEYPSSGTVSIGGRIVNDVDPAKRDVAMVFQSYALYPHKTVAQNIDVPLRSQKLPKETRSEMIAEAARALDIADLLGRKPAQLSGGQRQRVALARAIVRRPAVFLMDEPLSNLDAALRVQTRAELVDLHDRLDTTFVYVTHDQVEAMTMADRVAVIQEGKLQQVGPPSEVYDEPANTMVARFIGTPPMNLITGSPTKAPEVAPTDGREVVVGFRPEHVAITPDGWLRGKVLLVESLGHERLVHCEVPGGERVTIRVDPDDAIPHDGEPIGLAPTPGRIHWFDPSTGRRLP
ncbi:MAG: ABC transporter ATP-binding protein [Actinomycetia bacterium]|nr:ABC transporter ATP-binding protein [Actinomycetes bacterium]MCP4963142.1 ABC transporter ATP-binding protein [Actinomycetes bacterium]